MSFQTRESTASATGLTQYVLEGPNGSRAVIVPALGANCAHWEVAGRDVLYSPPLAELAERPTRGGIPVLFPFPNRIRHGHFVWNGREYQLPCNDSTKANAIHGFTPRAAWHVQNCKSERDYARLDVDFAGSRDAPAARDLWPADPRLSLAIQMSDQSLKLDATVHTDADTPLPFGLGYHPYFTVSPGDRIQTLARGRWELADSLPTGTVLPADGDADLRHARLVEELTLDDVYTDFPTAAPAPDGLVERGRVLYVDGDALLIRASPAFRELVLFTPPHRKAVCLEPYTCPTDAVNLAAAGRDVGWQVLAPGQKWQATVEFRLERC